MGSNLKKEKKFVYSLSIGLLMLAFVTACGNESKGTAESTEPGTAETVVSKDGVSLSKAYKGQTITFLTSGTPWTTALTEKIPEFEKLTGITVDVQQLVDTQLSNKIAISASSGGESADVLFYRPLQESLLFTKNNWLEDLSTYAKSDPAYDYEDFFQAGREITNVDGKIYGIPTSSERTMIFYNKEMLQKAGLTGAPKTFDELVAYAQKLHDPAQKRYALAVRGEGNSAVTQFAPFLRGFGGDFMKDGKATLNTPEAIKAFTFYGKLVREYSAPGAVNNIWSDSLALFIQGRAAIYIDGDVHYAETVDKGSSVVADQVGFGIFPKGTAADITPTNIISWAIGISSGSKHKGASWEFIKWATSKEVDLQLALKGNSSARDSTWKNPESGKVYPQEMIDVIAVTGEKGNPIDRPFLISGGEARSIVAEILTAAVFDKKDLQKIADDANVRFQALIDLDKKK